MRYIKKKGGKWLGYDGKNLHKFDTMEEAIEFRNKGVLPKKPETEAWIVPTNMLEEEDGDESGF